MEQTISWYVCERSPFDFGGPSVARIESSTEGGTFGDGIWVSAEVIFYAKPICIKGSPEQFVSDPSQMVLHELRSDHWTPAALRATPAYTFLQHVARQKGWPLEQDLGVE
eukprot:2111535-Pyramimonas_sp.AAC.1